MAGVLHLGGERMIMEASDATGTIVLLRRYEMDEERNGDLTLRCAVKADDPLEEWKSEERGHLPAALVGGTWRPLREADRFTYTTVSIQRRDVSCMPTKVGKHV